MAMVMREASRQRSETSTTKDYTCYSKAQVTNDCVEWLLLSAEVTDTKFRIWLE